MDDMVYLETKINLKLPNKALLRFDIEDPMRVIERKGSMVTAVNDQQVLTRNVSFFKKIERGNEAREDESKQGNLESDAGAIERAEASEANAEKPSEEPRRSTRPVRPVKRYGIGN